MLFAKIVLTLTLTWSMNTLMLHKKKKNDCRIVDKEMMIPGPVESKKEVSWKEKIGTGMTISQCNQRSFYPSQSEF